MFPPKTENKTATVRRAAKNEPPPVNVIVSVKAEKVISKAALAWALTHVVRPGDCVLLLAVLFDEKTERRRFWGFRRLKGDCRSIERSNHSDRISQIAESCSQMVLQFHNQIEVKVRIKVVPSSSAGTVAAEAKSNASNWVILDKKMKQEQKSCLEELHCNIVLMQGYQAKVLRLKLGYSDETDSQFFSADSSPVAEDQRLLNHRMKHSTPVSSPEEPNISYAQTPAGNLTNNLDAANSIFFLYEQNPLYESRNKAKFSSLGSPAELDAMKERIITPSAASISPSDNDRKVFWIPQNHIIDQKAMAIDWGHQNPNSPVSRHKNYEVRDPDLSGRIDVEENCEIDYSFNSSIREAVSLGRTSSAPPPLCSLCQHKAPAIGKPPRQFQFKELKEATAGFSDLNILARCSSGFVYRGILHNGLAVAVKQLKYDGSKGDVDFWREVQILSCAQHRNLVLLIGFCMDGRDRFLVYEYVCNGSLDFHLFGSKGQPLDLQTSLNIAIGTARGLRYLHEDCRVGCIIHGDIRPKNILLTHDFEPLLNDFALAKLHRKEHEFHHEKSVPGTSVYLAPEYFGDGEVSEKVDIYAFGLILLELLSGQKAIDLMPFNEHYLPENLHPLHNGVPIELLASESHFTHPNLSAAYSPASSPYEKQAMLHAASVCLQKDPELRPPMSKVLRILEGGATAVPLAFDVNTIGSRSSHMYSSTSFEARRRHYRRLSH